jgi:hypothetical protein
MDQENREKQPPIPDKLDQFLNTEQMMVLKQVESYGWHLEFVRRPLFQDPTIVVMGPGGKPVGTLEKDGSINQNPDIVIRD